MSHGSALILCVGLVLGWSGSATANTEGRFSGGSSFDAVTLVGEVSISCHEGVKRDFRRYTCVEGILNPGEYTYFVGPDGIVADHVEVKSTWEDGKGRTKSAGYDMEKGRSSKPFNLWIATLLQRPLLDSGLNVIDWKMSLSGKVVAAGQFSVTVNEAADQECPRGHYSSSRLDDCRFPSNICWRHFRAYGYCE